MKVSFSNNFYAARYLSFFFLLSKIENKGMLSTIKLASFVC